MHLFFCHRCFCLLFLVGRFPVLDYNFLSRGQPGSRPFMIQPALRTLRNARREACIVLAVWFIALIWTVGYCYVHGYRHSPDNLLVRIGWADQQPAALTQHRLGMPKWVCWGIFAPAV